MTAIIKNVSRLIDISLKTPNKAFNKIVSDITSMIRDRKCLRRKLSKNEEGQYKKIVKILLLNIYRNYYNTPQKCIAVSRDRNAFRPGTHYGSIGITYKAFVTTLNFLVQEGFIEQETGNYCRHDDSATSYTTRIIHTDKFIQMIEGEYDFNLAPEDFISPPKMDIVEVKEKVKKQDKKPCLDIEPRTNKRSKKKKTQYKPTICTKPRKLKELKRNLKHDNEFLAKQDIKIHLTQTQLRDAQTYEYQKPGSKEFHWAEHRLDLSENILKRVYNNPDLTLGGRFYGTWWINMKSEYRKYITVDNNPVVYCDFKALHINMLYHMEGLESPNIDPYSVEGIPEKYRPVLKIILQQAINAESHYEAVDKADLPTGWTHKQILDKLKEKHSPIKDHINSGIGLSLQCRDADICAIILNEARDKDIVILPIHDGFLVETPHDKDEIIEMMKRAYRKVMNTNHDIGVDYNDFSKDKTLSPEDIHQPDKDSELDNRIIRRLNRVINNFEFYSKPTQDMIFSFYKKYKEIPIHMLDPEPIMTLPR